MAGEVRTLLIPINEITVSPGRREAAPGDVKELADSILDLGLINPVMVDQSYTLIAGLHRLEAMKLLGRTEIECTVSDLAGLQAELAEIDENFIRKDLSVWFNCWRRRERRCPHERYHRQIYPAVLRGR